MEGTMLATLLESRSTADRSVAQVIVSVTAHCAIIGAALYATASAHPSTAARVSREWPVVYHPFPLPRQTTTTSATSSRSATPFSKEAWRRIRRVIPIDV